MTELTWDVLSADVRQMPREEVLDNLVGMLQFRYERGMSPGDTVALRRYAALVNAVRLLRP